MGKQETIHLRLDSELKEQFFKFAEERKESPSQLIRELMTQTVNNKHTFDQEKDAMYQFFISIMQVLINTSYKSKDDTLYNEINNSSILYYFNEAVSDHARYVSREHGADYDQVVNQEIVSKIGLDDFVKKNNIYNTMTPIFEGLKWLREQFFPSK